MVEEWEGLPPDEELEAGQEVRRRGRWWCRMHLFHRWRTHRRPDGTEFGARYQECLDCGKQRDTPTALPFAH